MTHSIKPESTPLSPSRLIRGPLSAADPRVKPEDDKVAWDDRVKDSSIQVVTFGCRLNTYESEVMKSLAKEAGLENAILVNTCAVTSEAERQARQTIRKLKRENPLAKIIVTGCSAQINAKQYSDMVEVERILGNEEKLKLESYKSDTERVLVNDIMEVTETALHLISGFEGKARAFVQVQNGCNHRCTFCTIPYGRGNSRSVPLGEIVTQVKTLLASHYQEIVFTGVDITDYGLDLPAKPTLGQTIKRLFTLVPELGRLRLSSIDPVEVDEDLWDLIAHEPRLMPHLHISLQAGDDMTLKRMKRRHLRQDVVDFCTKARKVRPDVVFGADIIAGFPTETDAMFENSRRLVEECDLTFLHVFPYSPRPGTPAARMPQVAKPVIKERAAILRSEGAQALSCYVKNQVGKHGQVLIESMSKDGYACGKTNHFAEARVNTHTPLTPGTVIPVVFTSAQGSFLTADVRDQSLVTHPVHTAA